MTASIIIGTPSVPPAIILIFNTIIVIIKIGVIALEITKAYKTLELLRRVGSQWWSLMRLVPVLLQLILLASYLAVYAVPEGTTLSLSLLLELLMLETSRHILVVSGKSLRVLLVMVGYCQTVLLFCAFLIDMRQPSPQRSLFENYMQLLK